MVSNTLFRLSIALIAISIPTVAIAQGRYTPVTDENILALKLNHYFTPDQKSHDADFQWSFTKDEFILKKGKGPIPKDLLQKLIDPEESPDEITGKWKLDEKNNKLILTEIKFGKKAGKKECTLTIYKTAPSVIRIGEPQYVFAIK